MKRVYYEKEGTQARAKEEEFNRLIPDSAVEDACKYIDKEFEPYARSEIKERKMVVRGDNLFEILTETRSSYGSYMFRYDKNTESVKFVCHEGDFK